MELKKYIKSLLVYEDFTFIKLAQEMAKETGRKYTPQSLAHKLNRETLRYTEMLTILKILGYDFKVIKKR